MSQYQIPTLKTCLKAVSVALLAGSLFACGGSSSSAPDNENPDPDPVNVDLSFMVQTYSGARLADAAVTLNENTLQSDEDGHVQFTLPSQESYVVRAEAEGFITQALKINGEEDGVMPIRLMPVKQTLSLGDIEAPRTLSAADLGARITFPADAFVTPDGEPATGPATVQITPWDITNGELNAMPGNGQAIDAMGESVELISAGMITVKVHNENGDYLQLAPDTFASIQMDLPFASINNQPLEVGSTIPMWHFDEELGEWVEDDSIIGTVVASATSPVGLAVYAEVNHFSTWNWDFKFENGGSIHVECRMSDNSAVPCGITMFTKNGHLPAGGSTIINMPSSATINWYATTASGLVGEHTKRFTASSEKLAKDQLDLGLFNEAESVEGSEESGTETADSEETIAVPAHTRRKKPRVSIPAHLPREEVLYELPEAERVCPHDGAELKAIGTEDHEQLEIIPAQVKVIVHRRQKYVCAHCGKHHATAAKPKQPIEKSIAGPGLLAYVATQKYSDALPLYRQSEIFKRVGLELDRTNLANWMVRCGQLVQPLINLLHEQLLAQPIIHLDETTLQVLNEPGKAAHSTSYMWVMGSFAEKPAVLFHYADSRRQDVPLALLDEGVNAIMVDGYEGYGKACADYRIARLGCWAHARRKLVDAKALQKKGATGKADQGLAFIQKLYVLEKAIKNQPPDERYQRRQHDAKPVIDKLKTWLEKSLPQVPPQSAIGKALYYLHAQWDRLVRYLDDGIYPIDNNRAENAIRPFTVGRKNWLFANSQAGAKASANLYSLIETAKANGLNPYEYLKVVFKELPNAQSVETIEKLLPWNASVHPEAA